MSLLLTETSQPKPTFIWQLIDDFRVIKGTA